MKKLFSMLMLSVCFAFVACDSDDDKSISVNQTIRSYIENKYPGAEIRRAEHSDRGLIEVEFLHDMLLKEAYFTSDNEWEYTEWDVALSNLPKAVSDAASEAYPDYRIDDADYYETSSGNYYKLDIEKGNYERRLIVTPEGEILTDN